MSPQFSRVKGPSEGSPSKYRSENQKVSGFGFRTEAKRVTTVDCSGMGSSDNSPKSVLGDGVSKLDRRPEVAERSSNSLIVAPKRCIIPPHIVAEAMSSLHGLDLRWSGPITPTEMKYVEQYVLARYPDQYEGWVVENSHNLSMPTTPSSDDGSMSDDRRKSPRNPRDLSPSFGNNLPDLGKTQLEPSRLLDILTKKASFPESSISIPEIHARNRVLRHCGLTDDDYMVVFTPGHKEALMLVGESYPFFRGNFYMTVLEEDVDCIREFATYKDAKAIPTPASWLNLRIAGSMLSQYFRRKCKHSPKGLFAYPAEAKGIRYSLHWVSEAHRSSWHVLLDATELTVGEDQLNLTLHKPDYVLCTLNKTFGHPTKITCLLVRRKSFDTSPQFT